MQRLNEKGFRWMAGRVTAENQGEGEIRIFLRGFAIYTNDYVGMHIARERASVN